MSTETLPDAALVPEVGRFTPAARAGFQVHLSTEVKAEAIRAAIGTRARDPDRQAVPSNASADPSAAVVTADGVFVAPDPERARALLPDARTGRAGR